MPAKQKFNTVDDVVNKGTAFAHECVNKHAAHEYPHPLKFSLVHKREQKVLTVCLSDILPRKSNQKTMQRSINIGGLDAHETEEAIQKLTDSLKTVKNVVPSAETGPCTKEFVKARIETELIEAYRQNPDDFPEAHSQEEAYKNRNNPAGIFSISEKYPTEKGKNANITINLRSYRDDKASKTEYTKQPLHIYFSPGTGDVAMVEKALEWSRETLRGAGWVEGKITGLDREAHRLIPASLVKVMSTGPLKLQKRKNFFVEFDFNTPRPPEASWSTGTDDPALAERRREALINDYLPQMQKKNAGFTLEQLSNWMDEHVPLPEKAGPDLSNRKDELRKVEDAGGKAFAKLHTPTLIPRYDGAAITNYDVSIRFSTIGGVAQDGKSLGTSLNTANKNFAWQRARDLQEVFARALENWQRDNPGLRISEEPTPGDPKHTRFATARIGDTSVPTGEIYFDMLADAQLRPTIEAFNRHICWEVDRAEKDGKVVLTLQAIRNDNEPLAGGISEPYTVTAESPAAAEAFEQTLHDAMFAQQFPDAMTSRERPVKHFRIPTQEVVVRESLATALRAHPEIDIGKDQTLAKFRSTTPDLEEKTSANEVVKNNSRAALLTASGTRPPT